MTNTSFGYFRARQEVLEDCIRYSLQHMEQNEALQLIEAIIVEKALECPSISTRRLRHDIVSWYFFG